MVDRRYRIHQHLSRYPAGMGAPGIVGNASLQGAVIGCQLAQGTRQHLQHLERGQSYSQAALAWTGGVPIALASLCLSLSPLIALISRIVSRTGRVKSTCIGRNRDREAPSPIFVTTYPQRLGPDDLDWGNQTKKSWRNYVYDTALSWGEYKHVCLVSACVSEKGCKQSKQ